MEIRSLGSFRHPVTLVVDTKDTDPVCGRIWARRTPGLGSGGFEFERRYFLGCHDTGHGKTAYSSGKGRWDRLIVSDDNKCSRRTS